MSKGNTTELDVLKANLQGGLSADIIGALQLSTELAGTGDLSGSLGALASATIAMGGSGAVTVGIQALGSMSADLTPFTELSPQNLANAVWNALAASFNTAGTMGLALANASSAGDPWSTVLPGAYPTGSAGSALVKLYQLAGLDPTKPLVVSATTRKVPADGSDISQTIVDASGTVTVTRT